MTGVVWPNGKAYFFKGAQYIAYDVESDSAVAGYPREIATSWLGVFDRDIDAVVVWPGGKAYFFRGDEYIRYDVEKDMADEGYPRPIAGNWPGLTFNSAGDSGADAGGTAPTC